MSAREIATIAFIPVNEARKVVTALQAALKEAERDDDFGRQKPAGNA